MEEEEEEALQNYCVRILSVVRSKQHIACSRETRRGLKHKGARGRKSSECERQTDARNEPGEPERDRATRTRTALCFESSQEVQPVPAELVSLLRLKTFREEIRRASEAELHDPAACSVCEQERASLAFESFIWRKKTQLHFESLKGRLNTLQLCRVCMCKPP